MAKKVYTIKSLAEESGLSEEYIRRAIRDGKLNSTKTEIFKNTFRHEMTQEDYENWRKNVSTRSQREDGRNKYTAYLTKSEMKEVRNLLKEAGLEEVEKLLVRTNKKS